MFAAVADVAHPDENACIKVVSGDDEVYAGA